MVVAYDEINCVVGGCRDFDDVDIMAAIYSTLALTADIVPGSGLWEERGRWFEGDPLGRWMMLRGLMLGPGEASVLNDLPLCELSEVLLRRRRVKFSGNDDNRLRGEEALRESAIKVEEVAEAENSAAAKIVAEPVEAVDLSCLSCTTPGIIKIGVYVQECIK